MVDLDTRVFQCEKDIKDLIAKYSAVEDKVKGAWKTIGEVNVEVGNLRTEIGQVKKDVETLQKRFTNMEIDMKETKTTMTSMLRLIKIMMIVLIFVGAISIGFFVYIWKHDAELATSILTLGSAMSKALPL